MTSPQCKVKVKMGAETEAQVAAPEIEVVRQPDTAVDGKQPPAYEKDDATVEAASINDPEKGYYSKLSVWLMVLFSGLAIGSDG